MASEIASQARIASLTKQLEASRAEAAEMQDRLMGFEGERRKLEARDTHICILGDPCHVHSVAPGGPRAMIH